MSQLLQNTWLRRGLIAAGAALAILCVFGAGFVAGRWNASSLGGPFSHPVRGLFFRGAHGAIGTIQAINDQTVTLQTRDGKTQMISLDNKTRFDKNFQKISLGDLKVGDEILVIGSPGADGQINARLVGVIDPSSRSFPWWIIPPGKYPPSGESK